jgi:hypothetical protein
MLMALLMPLVSADIENPVVNEVKIEISKTDIFRGDSITINVTLIGNSTVNVSGVPLSIMISEKSSGAFVMKKEGESYSDGTFLTFFTSNDSTDFGTYYVWVSVGNMSAFTSFDVVPDALDIYQLLLKILEEETRQSANFAAIPWIVLFGTLFGLFTILAHYFIRKLPAYTRRNIVDLSVKVFDWSFWKRMVGEIRDFDKHRYRKYNDVTLSMLETRRNKADLVTLHCNQFLERNIRRIDKVKKWVEESEKTVDEFRNVRDDAVYDSRMYNEEIEQLTKRGRTKAELTRDMLAGGGGLK